MGPIEPEFLFVAGLTEAGSMVFEQGYANSNQTGAWITDPLGESHAIALPDVAFSVHIPGVNDTLPNANVTMAGQVWATPWRIALIWRVHFGNGALTIETILLPTAGADASVTGMLDDGTVIGGLEFGQYFRPVIWSPPYDTYTTVLPPDENIASHVVDVGSVEGLRAGVFWPKGNMVSGHRHGVRSRPIAQWGSSGRTSPHGVHQCPQRHARPQHLSQCVRGSTVCPWRC
jgi:hypothetical protein